MMRWSDRVAYLCETRADRPVLFLDFDGVLNSARYLRTVPQEMKDKSIKHSTAAPFWFDPAAVSILNTVTDATGADIVVHSNWVLRHDPWAIVKLLKTVGVKATVRDCCAPFYNERTDRIDAWLELHKPERWAVVDDDPVVVKYFPRVVVTNDRTGITHEDASQLISLLMSPALSESADDGRLRRLAAAGDEDAVQELDRLRARRGAPVSVYREFAKWAWHSEGADPWTYEAYRTVKLGKAKGAVFMSGARRPAGSFNLAWTHPGIDPEDYTAPVPSWRVVLELSRNADGVDEGNALIYRPPYPSLTYLFNVSEDTDGIEMDPAFPLVRRKTYPLLEALRKLETYFRAHRRRLQG